jgi:PAS domain-containing protein
MPKPDEKEHLQTLFDHAPISLWEQDFSGIKRLFDRLRAGGVRSLEAHLEAHPDFVDECMRQIVVVRVNRQTLATFKAGSERELLDNLDKIFRDGMRHHMSAELLALWKGDLDWSGEGVNYALTGEPVEVLLHWRILPGCEQTWKQVLVTLENITARKQAERRFQNLFESSPISLWEEDYSALKSFFDELRAGGVADFEAYLAAHPQTVSHCMGLLKILNVNQKTIDLFGATSREDLLANLDKIFRDGMEVHFARELVDLWNGKLAYERDGINYSLNGEPIAFIWISGSCRGTSRTSAGYWWRSRTSPPAGRPRNTCVISAPTT